MTRVGRLEDIGGCERSDDRFGRVVDTWVVEWGQSGFVESFIGEGAWINERATRRDWTKEGARAGEGT